MILTQHGKILNLKNEDYEKIYLHYSFLIH